MSRKGIEAIYPLSPMQQGLLFHSLYTPGASVYNVLIRFTIGGSLRTVDFRRAWEQLVDRHGILRTSFIWERVKEPLQAVRERAPPSVAGRGLAGPLAGRAGYPAGGAHRHRASPGVRSVQGAADARDTHPDGGRGPRAGLGSPPHSPRRLVGVRTASRAARLVREPGRPDRRGTRTATPVPRLHRPSATRGPQGSRGVLARLSERRGRRHPIGHRSAIHGRFVPVCRRGPVPLHRADR